MARGSVRAVVLRNGQKRYEAVIDVGGAAQRKQETRRFKRRREAEEYLDRMSRDVREGEYFQTRNIPFNEFVAEWFRKYPALEPVKDSTLKSYFLITERYLKPFFGFMSVGRINALLIEKDFKAELPGDVSSKTKRNILMVLRTLLRTAVTWGYLKSNPFDPRNQRCVKLPDYFREQKGRALTPEESSRLLEACVDPDTFAIAATGLLSGMRIGELLALRHLDVDRKENKIHIRQQLYWRHGDFWGEDRGYVFRKPKSKASIRDIDLSPRLKAILLEYTEQAGPNKLDLVFTNSKGNPINPSNFLNRQFKPAVEAAGLGNLRFHDLRHTFGSMLIAQGQDLKYVQTQLGHSSIQVTVDVYGHLLKKSNPEAAAKLDEMIFGSAEKTTSR